MNTSAEQFRKNGFFIADDFLPAKLAHEIHDLYESEKRWKRVYQVREKHFEHVFKTKSPYLPKADEPYLAKFGRSDSLESSKRIAKLRTAYFNPALEKISGTTFSQHNLRCYRMEKGDFIRTHIDDYIGEIGCIYYVNESWVWDWGGILHLCPDVSSDESSVVFPKFNRAVFVNHGKWRFPHFVSTVSEYAEKPRYTMISFSVPG